MEDLLNKLYQGSDLSFEEARTAVTSLMSGTIDPTVTAAFLVALKLKGEKPAEIGGAARALQDRALKVHCDKHPLLDTCGTGGDGHHSINISTASAVLLAALGVTVAKHGNRAVSSRSGSADVLEALGINLDLGPEANEKLLDELGIAFLFAPRYHQAMKYVMPVRQALKTRTIFNLIGPLSNPARPTAQVLGVFQERLLEPMARALKDLGLERAFVVHGSGMDEICLHGPTNIISLEGGILKHLTLEPEALGIEGAPPGDLTGGDREENALHMKNILGGRDRGARARAVALNAAAGLLLAGEESEWAAAYQRAHDLLGTGAAARLLNRWAEASQDLK